MKPMLQLPPSMLALSQNGAPSLVALETLDQAPSPLTVTCASATGAMAKAATARPATTNLRMRTPDVWKDDGRRPNATTLRRCDPQMPHASYGPPRVRRGTPPPAFAKAFRDNVLSVLPRFSGKRVNSSVCGCRAT